MRTLVLAQTVTFDVCVCQRVMLLDVECECCHGVFVCARVCVFARARQCAEFVESCMSESPHSVLQSLRARSPSYKETFGTQCLAIIVLL